MKKSGIAEILIEYLVDEDILDKSVLKHSDSQPWLDSETVLKVKQFKLQARAQTARHEHAFAATKFDIEYKQNQSVSAQFDITKHRLGLC